MTEKVFNIVKKEKAKLATYGGVLQAHLDNLTEHEKSIEVDFLMVMGEGPRGLVYNIAEGSSISQAIGVLEVSKMHIVENSTADYDFE